MTDSTVAGRVACLGRSEIGMQRNVGALLGLVALVGSAPARADTGELEALLGESVVVTASRSAERASVAPATVFNITSAQMVRAGIRTVDEALELLGLGMYVSNVRDYVTGSDVGAQGVLLRDGGRHVLVMLDGVILNSAGTGRVSLHEGLGIPFEIIDHIEVMLGPGSVVYGSNAMLAVVNVVSKRAKDLGRVVATAELGTAAPTDANGRVTNHDGARWGLRYHLSVGAGTKLKLGRTEGEATIVLDWISELAGSTSITPFAPGPVGNHSFAPGETSWGGDSSHRMRAPSGMLTVTLGKVRLLLSVFDYDRTTPLTGTFADARSREHQTGVRFELKHAVDLTQKLNLASRLYGVYGQFSETSSYGESFWCVEGQNDGCRFEMKSRSGWIGLEQQLSIDWLANGKVVTLVGYDARAYLVETDPATYRDLATGAAPALAMPHSSEAGFRGALFLQQVWRPLGWLSLNVGGRLDIDSAFGVRFSPRAAAVFTPTEKTVVRLSYNEAYRAPSQYERHEVDPTFRIAPVGLVPETVRAVELELQQRVWRLALSVRGYASFYYDFIESRPATADEVAAAGAQLSATVDPANVVVNDNIGSLRVFGGSAALQVKLPRGFEVAYTFNAAHTEASNGSAQRLPTWYGNMRAGWQSSDDGYSVMAVGVYTSAREISYNASPTTLAPLGPRVDLRLTAAGPLGRAPGLSWRATIGGSIQTEQPYVLAMGATLPSGYVLYPQQNRLFGFIGLRYAWNGR